MFPYTVHIHDNKILEYSVLECFKTQNVYLRDIRLVSVGTIKSGHEKSKVLAVPVVKYFGLQILHVLEIGRQNKWRVKNTREYKQRLVWS